DGWREADQRSLMPQLAGETWDDLRFATLRRSLRAHTVHGGAQAQWRFAHEQMRRAVLNEISPGDQRVLHQSLAKHLWDLPREDPLHEKETMWHLLLARQLRVAATYYGTELTAGEAAGATESL